MRLDPENIDLLAEEFEMGYPAERRIAKRIWGGMILAAVAFGLMFALLTKDAAAQSMGARIPCKTPLIERAKMLSTLFQKYQEIPVSVKVFPSGKAILELVFNPWGDTYTVLLTNPAKQTCIVNSGTYRFAPRYRFEDVDFSPD